MQRYSIPSASVPGKAYTVTIHTDNVLSCDCPDAVYRKRQCKHQRFVLQVWTPAGRSGALVAQHAAQVQAETAEHGYGAYVNAVALCRCGWQSQPTIDALCELAAHVSAARRGERVAERVEENAARLDLSEVYKITRAVW